MKNLNSSQIYDDQKPLTESSFMKNLEWCYFSYAGANICNKKGDEEKIS